MKLINELEANDLNATDLIKLCWERGFMYQDYVNTCEYLKREPASKQTYHSLCTTYEIGVLYKSM